jgi:hypothetical protein
MDGTVGAGPREIGPEYPGAPVKATGGACVDGLLSALSDPPLAPGNPTEGTEILNGTLLEIDIWTLIIPKKDDVYTNIFLQ